MKCMQNPDGTYKSLAHYMAAQPTPPRWKRVPVIRHLRWILAKWDYWRSGTSDPYRAQLIGLIRRGWK